MIIYQKDHYLLQRAVQTAKQMDYIGFREQDILDNFAYFETEQQTGFKTADVYDGAGNGFQIVVRSSVAHQAVGSITN